MNKKVKKKKSLKLSSKRAKIAKKALRFMPHVFKSKVKMMDQDVKKACILLSQTSYDKMYHYANVAKEEVGWLGTVVKKDDLCFYIKDVFLFDQKVHEFETDISKDALARFSQEVLMQNKNDGIELLNQLRFWGHLHPFGSTSPSKQDDDQMKVFKDSGCKFFVRGIVTKDGKIEFTLYLYDKGIVIKDVPWTIHVPVDKSLEDQIKEEYERKVSYSPPPVKQGDFTEEELTEFDMIYYSENPLVSY